MNVDLSTAVFVSIVEHLRAVLQEIKDQFLHDAQVAAQGTLEEALAHPDFVDFARDAPQIQTTQ